MFHKNFFTLFLTTKERVEVQESELQRIFMRGSLVIVIRRQTFGKLFENLTTSGIASSYCSVTP